MSKEAMKLALEALLWANNEINEWRDEAHGYTPEDQPVIMSAITALREALAEQPAQPEPVAWVPYLSDRADGVKGHYAIARWNPRGYREVWNLRRHEWGAYSDDVLSLEEADTLLRLITIPTRKVTSPQPAPVQQEPVQEQVKTEHCLWSRNGNTPCPHTSPPAQRKPLTDDQCHALCDQIDAMQEATAGDYAVDFVRAIEAAHNIKENT